MFFHAAWNIVFLFYLWCLDGYSRCGMREGGEERERDTEREGVIGSELKIER